MSLKQQINILIDTNQHTDAAITLVNLFGTDFERMRVHSIASRHRKYGRIDLEDMRERNEIVRKYHKLVSI
jgi:hypothetical protein